MWILKSRLYIILVGDTPDTKICTFHLIAHITELCFTRNEMGGSTRQASVVLKKIV